MRLTNVKFTVSMIGQLFQKLGHFNKLYPQRRGESKITVWLFNNNRKGVRTIERKRKPPRWCE